MYDELIKRLWECVSGECWNCSQHKDSYDGQRTCADKLMKQAADAIEELQEKLIMAETDLSDFKDAMAWKEHFDILAEQDCQVPKWIPVTERLPEDGSLVGKLIADSDGEIRIASQCSVITLSGGKTVYTDLIDLVSFLAKDTPTIEWDDCTHITHWMPLPEPPKEGEL